MKRIRMVILAICLCTLLTGCGETTTDPDLSLESIQRQTVPQENTESEAEETATAEPSVAEFKIDIDIKKMNDMLVFSTVNSIIEQPFAYIGKRIKLQGYYSHSYDKTLEENCHYLVVSDPLACCFPDGAISLEIVLPEGYGDDYPQDDQLIECIGIVDSYQKGRLTRGCVNIEQIAKTDHWLEEILSNWQGDS